MKITANNHLYTTMVQSTNSVSRQNVAAEGKEIAASAANNLPQNYDFTNMSRREFDRLWKAGEIKMDLPPLVVPEGGLDLTKDIKTQVDAVYDNKINFIEYYQKSIEFQKSLPQTEINQRTLEHYETGLNALMDLQGKTRQSGIDVEV